MYQKVKFKVLFTTYKELRFKLCKTSFVYNNLFVKQVKKTLHT